MFAPFEHEEDGAENFVTDGDDGALVATPDDERLEFRLEYRLGATGSMGKLAEQTTDVEIALADVAGLALAGRLVVAGADADPGGQTIGAAEGIHIGANLDEQHRSADQIDAGNRLQQGQGSALGFELGQQASIEAGDACLDLFDVTHQFVENETVTGSQVALQGIEDFLPAGLQAGAGQFQYLLGRKTCDDRLDHGAGRFAVEIADHHPEPNAAVGEHLVQPILLGCQLADQFLPLASDQAQFPQFGRRHKRASQQSCACQHRQPVGVPDIGLASGNVLDVPGIDHLRPNTRCLQRCIRTLPVNAGAFHHDFVRVQRGHPVGKFAAVALEATELPLLDMCAAISFLDQAQAVICA